MSSRCYNNKTCGGLQNVVDISSQRPLELDITYVCDMACLQCNRALGLIGSHEMMTIDQVSRVLHESASMQRPYLEIRVLGGEPTLHPHLSGIVDTLDWYRRQVGNCSVSLWTHGHGEQVKQEIGKLPAWIRIRVSAKQPKVVGEGFDAFLAAPLDYQESHAQDYWNGCGQIAPGRCGIGVSPYGVYSCPCAAAIDRIVGLDIGLTSLTDACDERFRKQCDQLCRYCGHFLVDRGVQVSTETVSDTWQVLRDRYRTHRPRLVRY